MNIRLSAAAAVIAVMMSGPGWCYDSASPRSSVDQRFFAMLGQFEPTEGGLAGHTALAITYSWKQARRYAAVQYTRSTSGGVIASVPFSATGEAFTAVGGARWWRGKWYCGAGAGLSHLERETLTPIGMFSDTDTNLAWELLVGAPLGGRGLAEIKYIDADDDSARGFAAFVGVTY